MSKTALIAGATGLVGKFLLKQIIYDDYYDKVIVISRRQPAEEHTKVKPVLVPDFDKLSDYKNELKADDVFCCLGTTMAKAGSKKAFKKVDYDYVLALAELSRENNASQFLMISALGANKNSKVFYNKVKGEIEEAVANTGFPEIHIFRPSLLIGPRQEKRVGEDAAKTLYSWFNFLFAGPLKKYKGIEAEQVARAMLHFSKENIPGIHIHENKELLYIT